MIKIGFVLSVVAVLIAWGLSVASLSGLSNVLVIHFDKYRGIDFLGDKSDLLGILAVGSFWVLLNLALARVFYHRDRLLPHLLAGGALFVAVLILITAAVIISVN